MKQLLFQFHLFYQSMKLPSIYLFKCCSLKSLALKNLTFKVKKKKKHNKIWNWKDSLKRCTDWIHHVYCQKIAIGENVRTVSIVSIVDHYMAWSTCARASLPGKDKQIRSYVVCAFEIDSFSKRICLYADVVCVILIEWLHGTRPDKRLLIICRWNCTMFHREGTQPAVKPFSRIGNVLLFRGYLISGLRTEDD